MDENRTEDQKVAAVAASMTMAGQPMTGSSRFWEGNSQHAGWLSWNAPHH